jgi:hypothetical protein
MSEPTPGEIMRRLEDNTAWLNRISAQLREDRDRADLRYVPRVEWIEARGRIGERIEDVAGDVEDLQTESRSAAAFRRQSLLLFAIAAFSGVVAVAIAAIGLFFGSP